jgi:O-acetyl-ADP-ribose deacetylase (regulator of RNase III)
VPASEQRTIGTATLEVRVGDITTLDLDAIVNAANSRLQLGAGVAGAIRRSGGPTIQHECDRIGRCPIGGAVRTGAGDLPCRHVIHAVGPVWGSQSEQESDELLRSACREALRVAREHGLASIALPSISTGVFGFPLERAAPILLGEAQEHLRGETTLRRVVLCLFDEPTFEVYRDALARLA